ncbi:MAG: condensation domain-containing protein, partial [Actinomycetota bacterium]|nr:condensation domain-containing protein [Actinomycetota bacterium]
RVRAALEVEVSPRALFTHPTVAGLAAAIAADAQPGAPALSSIPVLPREGDLPLSFAQQRLWFLNQFEPDSAEYITPTALRFRGQLDVDALTTALTGLVARHESLRTTFDSVDGHGVQVVHPPYQLQLPMLDLSELAQAERDTALASILEQDSTTPFDLRQGPLLRPRLVRLATDEHVLSLVLHHIITDGWSTGVLVDELGVLYAAVVRGQPAQLPALPLQYADFAIWQRNQLSEQTLTEQLDYWKRQLSNVAPLELPTDRPRPAVRTSAGAVYEFHIPATVTAALNELGRRYDSTLFITLIAACQLLLHRWSGQDDIAVGTVTSGREKAELERLIGFFVNTLVLRSTVGDNHTFIEFLHQVRGTILDAFAHQDVPFERLVDELQPVRDTSHTPLFQVMVLLQNIPGQIPDLPGLKVDDVAIPVVTANFDLLVQFTELDDGDLHAAVNYNTDLFDPATIERMAGHLQILLTELVAHPTVPLRHLDILTKAERHRVLHEWNNTALDVTPVTLPELFQAQVARTPDLPAVIFEGTELSYAELDARANRLARLLIHRGAGPERIVALVLPRSADIVVAQLAVAKAGAAFLPVDPTYPAKRIAFMLSDAKPVLVITLSDIATQLPWPEGMTVLAVDSAETVSALEGLPDVVVADADRASPLLLQHPAYVIYTSGSTGQPKGVLVSHAGLASFSAAEIKQYAVRTGDRVLQFSSPSFDASVLELCMALPAGAALVVPPPSPLLGEQLAEVLTQQRVTHALIPPAALATVPQAVADTGVPEFQTVIVGGDVCPAELVDRWAPGRRMINSYGPTESTVVSTWSQPLIPGGTPPIGRPIWNTKVYVLDAALRPVPPGVPGELYVAGVGLARGYL